MLHILTKETDAVIDGLFFVYRESMDALKKNFGQPGETPEETEANMRKEYTAFVRDFIAQPNQRLCIWEEAEQPVSALRLIAWEEDTWFLEALETAPSERKKGYAQKLITACIESLAPLAPKQMISFINRNNAASMCTHKACGFQPTDIPVVYPDGTKEERSIRFAYRYPEK